MASKTLHHTIEELGADSSLEVAIDYYFTPGEPMVRYDRNGDGYPGSPAHVDIEGVVVTRWDVGKEQRKPTDHWIWNELNKLADRIIDDQLEKFEALCLEDGDWQ